jgi:hypothetical protein
MKTFEIISIEPTNLANHWVVSFKIAGGKIVKESVQAHDSNDAFIKFRNQMIQQFKAEDQTKKSTKKVQSK